MQFRASKLTKLVSLIMCMAMLTAVFAACGNKNEPASSTAEPQGEDPASTAPVEPEPESVYEPLEAAFLTGEEKTADYPEGQRIAAVMVGNDRGAWPHQGLSEAKIVYEVIVESWWITRLMAIYEDYTAMPDVAPVRSARDQFFQFIAPFQAFYIHDGPNESEAPVNQMINQLDYWDFNLDTQRSHVATSNTRPGYNSPYSTYTNASLVEKDIEKFDLDPKRSYNSTIFSFAPYNQPARVPGEGNISSFVVSHTGSNFTGFDYNGSQYVVSMNNGGSMQTLTDGNNGKQVAFDNVLVLFAPMQLYNNSILVQVDYNAGAGFYFSEGGFETVRWDKGSAGTPLSLSYLSSDEDFFMNPGTTYICVVNDSQLESFDGDIRAGSSVASGDLGTPQGTDD